MLCNSIHVVPVHMLTLILTGLTSDSSGSGSWLWATVTLKACLCITLPLQALLLHFKYANFPIFWSSLLDQLCTQGPAGALQRFPLITSFIKYFVFYYWNRITLILGNGSRCYTETGAQPLNTVNWRRNEELNRFVRELKMWLVELALLIDDIKWSIVYNLG